MEQKRLRERIAANWLELESAKSDGEKLRFEIARTSNAELRRGLQHALASKERTVAFLLDIDARLQESLEAKRASVALNRAKEVIDQGEESNAFDEALRNTQVCAAENAQVINQASRAFSEELVLTTKEASDNAQRDLGEVRAEAVRAWPGVSHLRPPPTPQIMTPPRRVAAAAVAV